MLRNLENFVGEYFEFKLLVGRDILGVYIGLISSYLVENFCIRVLGCFLNLRNVLWCSNIGRELDK